MDNAKSLNQIKVILEERTMSNKELAEMIDRNPATVSK
jgi:predicted transcriptional regulator